MSVLEKDLDPDVTIGLSLPLNYDINSGFFPGTQTTLTQTSSNAPVATVLSSNLTGTFTWARTSAGIYTLTASTATFTSGKTIVFLNNGSDLTTTQVPPIVWERTSDTVLTITVGFDASITNGSFEVRIYT